MRACGRIIDMRLAAVRNLARRLHRGQIDETGELYVEHLGRVAALVQEAGGTRVQLMAAWLHGVPSAGTKPPELAALGVPPAAVGLIEALTPRPYEGIEAHLARVLSCRGAALVFRAVYADRCRPDLLAALEAHRRTALTRKYRQILTALDDTAALAAFDAADHQSPGAPDVPALIAALEGDNPGRCDAVTALERAGDPRAIPRLIDVYLRGAAGDPAWAQYCASIHRSIYVIARDPRNLADPEWTRTLVELAGHDNDGLRAIALGALARTGDPAHGPLLRRALDSEHPNEVVAGIEALREIDLTAATPRLTAILGRDAQQWRYARSLAAQLLQTVDDPRAQAALAANLGLLGAQPRDIARRLKGGDPSIIADLIEQLRIRSPGREAAAQVLGELRAGEALADLVAALRDAGDSILLAVSCADRLR